ncbi:hypothetical protein D3C78_1778150 [compost metagenome]
MENHEGHCDGSVEQNGGFAAARHAAQFDEQRVPRRGRISGGAQSPDRAAGIRGGRQPGQQIRYLCGDVPPGGMGSAARVFVPDDSGGYGAAQH